MAIKVSLEAANPLPGLEQHSGCALMVPESGHSGSATRAIGRPFEFPAVTERLNHNVFRYPAKFHPPIARHLIETFSQPGERIFDPFCGSGTALVEALVAGRSAVGTDIDPLAVFVSKAKIHRYDMAATRHAVESMTARIAGLRAEDEARWGGFDKDASAEAVTTMLVEQDVTVPEIPRISHWFRHRAQWQLGSIRKLVREEPDEDVRLFLTLCFASIVRGSSNADPVPVSGLEVTSHMLRKEAAGREIDPYRLFERAMRRTLKATAEFADARSNACEARATVADARLVSTDEVGEIDTVVTSPPYLTAVDYYRRHTLEMYWLDLVSSQSDRLELMPAYIGRDRVGGKHLPDANAVQACCVADRWLERFTDLKPERTRAFRHYCDGMARAMSRMSDLVRPGGKVVVVAGDVTFASRPVSMLELMTDLADDGFELHDHLWYPIKNRYMSYSRKNEANIAADRIIVFRRR